MKTFFSLFKLNFASNYPFMIQFLLLLVSFSYGFFSFKLLIYIFFQIKLFEYLFIRNFIFFTVEERFSFKMFPLKADMRALVFISNFFIISIFFFLEYLLSKNFLILLVDVIFFILIILNVIFRVLYFSLFNY